MARDTDRIYQDIRNVLTAFYQAERELNSIEMLEQAKNLASLFVKLDDYLRTGARLPERWIVNVNRAKIPRHVRWLLIYVDRRMRAVRERPDGGHDE